MESVGTQTALGGPPGGLLRSRLAAVAYEHLAREWTQTASLDLYDGLRVEALKRAGSATSVAHALLLGSALRRGGALYAAGADVVSPDESIVVMARAANDGTVTLRALRRWDPTLETKLNISSSLCDASRNTVEVSLDKGGGYIWDAAAEDSVPSCIYSAKYAWQGTHVLGLAYSQRVWGGLQAGGDVTLVSAGMRSFASVGARYAHPSGVFLSATVSRAPGGARPAHAARTTVARRVGRLSLGAELVADTRGGALRAAYEYAFRNARVAGLLDSAGRLEMSAQELSGFGVCAQVDLLQNDYKFGFLMNIVPPK